MAAVRSSNRTRATERRVTAPAQKINPQRDASSQCDDSAKLTRPLRDILERLAHGVL